MANSIVAGEKTQYVGLPERIRRLLEKKNRGFQNNPSDVPTDETTPIDNGETNYINARENVLPPNAPTQPTSPMMTGDEPPPVPPRNPNQPSIAKSVADGLPFSPYYEQIKANEAKRLALQTQPVVDKNGRVKSFGIQFLKGLQVFADPRLGPVRDVAQLFQRGASAIGEGIGGAIFSNLDETQARDMELAKIDQDNERLQELGQRDWQYQKDQEAISNQRRDDVRNQNQFNVKTDLQADRNATYKKSVEDKIEMSKFRKTSTQQQTALKPIFERGYYQEGDNPQEDALLEKLGIILPDFDKRKPQIKEQNGQYYSSQDGKAWQPIKEIPVDESEVPIDFMVNGQKLKLRPRDIAGIEAAKLRQEDQQQFTATQNQLTRDNQNRLTAIKSQQDANNGETALRTQLTPKVAKGEITQAQMDSIIQNYRNGVPPQFRYW